VLIENLTDPDIAAAIAAGKWRELALLVGRAVDKAIL
jgi:hypothetical protein